jgi:hypothetical protein
VYVSFCHSGRGRECEATVWRVIIAITFKHLIFVERKLQLAGSSTGSEVCIDCCQEPPQQYLQFVFLGNSEWDLVGDSSSLPGQHTKLRKRATVCIYALDAAGKAAQC